MRTGIIVICRNGDKLQLSGQDIGQGIQVQGRQTGIDYHDGIEHVLHSVCLEQVLAGQPGTPTGLGQADHALLDAVLLVGGLGVGNIFRRHVVHREGVLLRAAIVASDEHAVQRGGIRRISQRDALHQLVIRRSDIDVAELQIAVVQPITLAQIGVIVGIGCRAINKIVLPRRGLVHGHGIANLPPGDWHQASIAAEGHTVGDAGDGGGDMIRVFDGQLVGDGIAGRDQYGFAGGYLVVILANDLLVDVYALDLDFDGLIIAQAHDGGLVDQVLDAGGHVLQVAVDNGRLVGNVRRGHIVVSAGGILDRPGELQAVVLLLRLHSNRIAVDVLNGSILLLPAKGRDEILPSGIIRSVYRQTHGEQAAGQGIRHDDILLVGLLGIIDDMDIVGYHRAVDVGGTGALSIVGRASRILFNAQLADLAIDVGMGLVIVDGDLVGVLYIAVRAQVPIHLGCVKRGFQHERISAAVFADGQIALGYLNTNSAVIVDGDGSGNQVAVGILHIVSRCWLGIVGARRGISGIRHIGAFAVIQRYLHIRRNVVIEVHVALVIISRGIFRGQRKLNRIAILQRLAFG